MVLNTITRLFTACLKFFFQSKTETNILAFSPLGTLELILQHFKRYICPRLLARGGNRLEFLRSFLFLIFLKHRSLNCASFGDNEFSIAVSSDDPSLMLRLDIIRCIAITLQRGIMRSILPRLFENGSHKKSSQSCFEESVIRHRRQQKTCCKMDELLCENLIMNDSGTYPEKGAQIGLSYYGWIPNFVFKNSNNSFASSSLLYEQSKIYNNFQK